MNPFFVFSGEGRRCLPQAVQAAAEADIALLVVSAKGRELEAALREVG